MVGSWWAVQICVWRCKKVAESFGDSRKSCIFAANLDGGRRQPNTKIMTTADEIEAAIYYLGCVRATINCGCNIDDCDDLLWRLRHDMKETLRVMRDKEVAQ